MNMERFAHQDAVKALLDHLDIRKAHFAARLDTDWRDLVARYPDLVSLSEMGRD